MNPTIWIRWLAQHPVRVLGGALLLTVGALALCVNPHTFKPRLKIDPSAEALLPTHAADRALLEHVRQTFGEDDPVIVAVGFTPNVFTAENLEKIDALTQAFRGLPGVGSVLSLATAPNLVATGDDLIVTSFTEQARAAPERVAQFPKELAANPLYRGTLVSEDGRFAA